uniref:F-box domain-containing protein n=1 Tax=Parastrongyloides trichosuri TaxID=131310 RepID=A0A0N5A5R9_PARTI
MSLETALSQYPISKSVISNIKSITDITNLINTSPYIYDNLHDATIRKTISVPSDALVIKYASVTMDSNNILKKINMVFEGVTSNTDELYIYLKKSKNVFEHVNTIRIDLDNLYVTFDFSTLDVFATNLASFIDKVFDLCPNADTLEVYSVICVHFSIIKKLQSSKIRVIKDSTFNSMMYFSKLNADAHKDVVSKLRNLEQFNIFIGEIELYFKPHFMEVFEDILKHLSKKENSKIIISGHVRYKNVHVIENFLSITQKYNVQVCLKGGLLCHKAFFEECITRCGDMEGYPLDNITELDVSLWNLNIHGLFFTALPYFKNLKVIKIDFEDQIFKHLMEDKTMRTFNRCFSSKLLSRLTNLEEIYLRFENWDTVYDSPEEYQNSFLVKNNVAKEIFSYLGENIKVLYFDGISDLTKEMGDILSQRCPNLEDIFLQPLNSMDAHFVENFKKLKFINLKGIYRLNVPENVEMVIVHSYKDDNAKKIAILDDDTFYNYFKELFNRSFKISLRNCDRGYHKYNILFNNIFLWNTYPKKMNNFKQVFNY